MNLEFLRGLPRIFVTSHVEQRVLPPKDGERGPGRVLRSQVAYLVSIDEYGQETRARLRLGLGDSQQPYSEGEYTFGGASFRVGKYGDPELSRFDVSLLPLPAAQVKEVRAA